MTTSIDRNAAEQKARDAFATWGHAADLLAATDLDGGWRFHAIVAGGRAVGGSDALVRAADGAVLRLPAGASDQAAERLLHA